MRLLHNPDGSMRTRNELEVRTGKFAVVLQREILDGYDRCHDFFDDSSSTEVAWKSWLDKSAAAGYPPAQSLEADVERVSDLMSDAANPTSGDTIPPTSGPARELALRAALSGDPDSILEMANWIDGTTRSMDDYGDLVGAWELLACQRGYEDCGSDSTWLRSMCSWDAQCADDSSITDSLKRQYGGRFDNIQNLAKEIQRAIDQRDQKTLESYL